LWSTLQGAEIESLARWRGVSSAARARFGLDPVYQFSRAIYRDLLPLLAEAPDARSARFAVLAACERNVERLATDRHYFAHPTRTLFNDVRMHFPLGVQVGVYRVIERHMDAAAAHFEEVLRAGLAPEGGSAPACQAFTRNGAGCKRGPIPGMRYCPSHKHLENGRRESAA
jgi:hypothetical protein